MFANQWHAHCVAVRPQSRAMAKKKQDEQSEPTVDEARDAAQAAQSETQPADGDSAVDAGGDGPESAPSEGGIGEVAQAMMLVGIGASAGGLEALKELLTELPKSDGLSYVIAQHLSPTHTSLLRDLLMPGTELAVVDLKDDTAPKSNTVYITPPNYDVRFVDGRLRLSPPKASVGPKPSVDLFFHSLAESLGENTIGIILSGTGSDGASGIRAIKAAGGITLAQEPTTAKYDGMPRAAVQTGCVDVVTTASKMGEVLGDIAATPAHSRVPMEEDASLDANARVTSVVKRQTGLDLRHYKPSTVNRRIARRMGLRKLTEVQAYADVVRQDVDEASQLARDVLISVTSFFRDPQPFEELKSVMARAVKKKTAGDVYRVWVPGCATGEEAYSLAIMMNEITRDLPEAPEFLIFATDLDADAVNFARTGIYPEPSVDKLSEQLRTRYFDRTGPSFQVKKFLRQNMVFANQNVVDDPPFSRMDLITCRNLLIYFTRDIQKRVLETFHYSLNSEGLLFLGSSESIELHRELFADINKKARIYRRRETANVYVSTTPRQPMARQVEEAREVGGRRQRDVRTLYAKFTEQLVDAYAPPAVVVGKDDVIVHFSGELGPYLRFPKGGAELSVYELVHESMRAELRALLHRARREGNDVRGTAVRIGEGEQSHRVMPTVRPFEAEGGSFVLLSFEQAAESLSKTIETLDDRDVRESLIISELEDELASTRQHLQTVVEELETSNEELQSQSEELQSANEELQSTNEELQTSNEELQSTNEELLTVNDEMQSKSAELESLATDLQNVKESLDFPLLVVDSRLHVTQANDSAQVLLAEDGIKLGESVVSIDWAVDLDRVLPTIRATVQKGEIHEVELEPSRKERRSFMLRCMPYKRSDGRSNGAVLGFLDNSERRETERALRERETLFRVTFERSGVGMAMINADGKLDRVNEAMAQLLDTTESRLSGTPFDVLFHPESVERLNRDVEALRGDHERVFRSELRIRRASEWRWVDVSASAMEAPEGGGTLIIAQLQDITDRKLGQERLVEESRRLRLLNNISGRIARGGNESTIVQEALKNLADTFPALRVSYASLVEGDLLHRHSIGTVELDALDGVKLPGGKVGAISKSLNAGDLVASPDITADDRFSGVEDALSEHNIAARVMVPLVDGESLTGVLCVDSPAAHRWRSFELDTFSAVGELLSVSIRDASALAARLSSSQALADTKERIEVTLQALGEGVITTDQAGKVAYMNRAAEQLLETGSADCIGQVVGDLYPLVSRESGKAIGDVVQRCLREQSAITIPGDEGGLDLGRESRVAVDTSVAPLRDRDENLIGAVLVFRDVTDEHLLTEELAYRATHDQLTGLINRDEFDRHLTRAFRQAKAGDVQHVLCYLDLDNFKFVNDTEGHAAGDEMLRQLALAFRARLRQSDILARLGGDEFGILLENCPAERGEAIAETILKTANAFRFEWRGKSLSVSASLGVVPFSGQAVGVAELLSRADAACFIAKEQGRNRLHVSFEDDASYREHHGEMKIVGRISDALDGEGFVLHYENVVAIADGEPGDVVYRELLIRMTGLDGDLLPPAEFVPAAERYYLAAALDRWVVEQAITYLATHPDSPPLGVNISGQTLSDGQFVDHALRCLETQDVDPSRLCFEITETAAISHLSEAVHFMEVLRGRGCRFALDDFGTGMSSFTYLKNLPVDFVKIDGAFVRNLAANPVDRTMVEAVANIARELNLRTIAEHVESVEEVALLTQLGIDHIQGHYLGQSAPLDEV